MRDELNDILNFIGSESLSDLEFDSIDLADTLDPIAVYNSLLLVLQSRESVSDTILRLQNFFLAQGIAVVSVVQSTIAQSNIFLGAPLEDDLLW